MVDKKKGRSKRCDSSDGNFDKTVNSAVSVDTPSSPDAPSPEEDVCAQQTGSDGDAEDGGAADSSDENNGSGSGDCGGREVEADGGSTKDDAGAARGDVDVASTDDDAMDGSREVKARVSSSEKDAANDGMKDASSAQGSSSGEKSSSHEEDLDATTATGGAKSNDDAKEELQQKQQQRKEEDKIECGVNQSRNNNHHEMIKATAKNTSPSKANTSPVTVNTNTKSNPRTISTSTTPPTFNNPISNPYEEDNTTTYPDDKDTLLTMSFNQDGGCLAVGTGGGFRICNVHPFQETFRRTLGMDGDGGLIALFVNA